MRRRRSRPGDDNDNAESISAAARSPSFPSDFDEIGELLETQGRCLDEANANLHTVQKENAVLRDRLSGAVSSSSSSRFPLRNMTNHKSDRQSKALVEENRLLTEQAAILSSELCDANRALADREANMASLGKSLAVCIEKRKASLAEKSSLEEALLVKTKEAEGSLAIVVELEANAKSSLEEREEVAKDAASHAEMADGLTRSLEKAQASLASKHAEVESLATELAASKREAASALREKETSTEAALSLRRSLSSSVARNEKLEREIKEVTTRSDESKIAQHSLQVSHSQLQAEIQVRIRAHHLSSRPSF